jgi:putative phosphonate metabolism protein
MSGIVRYAIYWLPEGPLRDWGEAWLGWQMATGTALPRPDVAGLPGSLADLTAAATVYGLHATIKPPFRLAEGQDDAALRAAFAAFCAAQAPVTAGGLHLTDLDGFLALTPEGGTEALDALAGRVVAALDAFRAPAPEQELTRRRAAGLSPRQEAMLQRWGYPYVMEEFRFHVTLTGRLTPDQAAAVRRAIAPALAPLLPRPLRIGGLSLVGQMAQGGFRLIAHHDFPG